MGASAGQARSAPVGPCRMVRLKPDDAAASRGREEEAMRLVPGATLRTCATMSCQKPPHRMATFKLLAMAALVCWLVRCSAVAGRARHTAATGMHAFSLSSKDNGLIKQANVHGNSNRPLWGQDALSVIRISLALNVCTRPQQVPHAPESRPCYLGQAHLFGALLSACPAIAEGLSMHHLHLRHLTTTVETPACLI